MEFGIQMESLTGGLVSFLIGLVSIFGCHYLTKYTNLFDKPDQVRKFHVRITPNSGGIGIAIAYVLGLLLVGLLAAQSISNKLSDFLPYFSFGTIIVIGLGVTDDLRGLSFKSKFIIQISAAIITCVGIEHTYMDGYLAYDDYGTVVSFLLNGGLYAVFIFWIVSIANSMNLIDGVDGLASVLTILIICGLSIIGYSWGKSEYSLILFPLGGAVFAFLLYNRPPAYIFMGDTGSLLIGYALGTVALVLAIQSNHWMKGLSLIFLFGVPLLDTLFAVMRRVINNISPFESDSYHIHHLIQKYYKSPGMAILIIGTVSLLLTGISIVLAIAVNPVLFYSLFGLTVLVFCIAVLVYYMLINKNDLIIKTSTKPVKSQKRQF